MAHGGGGGAREDDLSQGREVGNSAMPCSPGGRRSGSFTSVGFMAPFGFRMSTSGRVQIPPAGRPIAALAECRERLREGAIAEVALRFNLQVFEHQNYMTKLMRAFINNAESLL